MKKTIKLEYISLLSYTNTVEEMIMQYIKQSDNKKGQKKKEAKRKRARYLRSEPKYNAHQDNEFLFFISTLPFFIFNALASAGLKLNKLNFEMYFISHICLAIKEYFDMSLRRARGLCKFIFWAMKWKSKIPCFKTLDNYMMNRDTKIIRDKIIEFVVDPLKCIETHFNIDSTCDSLLTSSTWYNYRIGRKIKKKDHLKEHITSTAKYNAAVAVDISSEGDAK